MAAQREHARGVIMKGFVLSDEYSDEDSPRGQNDATQPEDDATSPEDDAMAPEEDATPPNPVKRLLGLWKELHPPSCCQTRR
jgi:hypothetical protein